MAGERKRDVLGNIWRRVVDDSGERGARLGGRGKGASALKLVHQGKSGRWRERKRGMSLAIFGDE
jgi:hypothetical protein